MSRASPPSARQFPSRVSGLGSGRLVRGGLVVAALAAGAAGGWLVPRAGQWLGGGWVHWGLAAWGIFFVTAYAARSLGRMRDEPLVVAGILLLGPLCGGLAGFLAWGHTIPWLGDWPWTVVHSLGFADSHLGGAAAGALLGLGIAAFLDAGDVDFAGAVLGLGPGAALGLLGSWTTDLWFISPVFGGLIALVLVRTALVGQSLHLGTFEGMEVVPVSIAGAIIGLLLCGLAPYAVWGVEWLELWSQVADFLLFVCQLPPALCNRAGFESGWLGGLFAGAIIATYVLGRWYYLDEKRADGFPPLEILAGGVLGILDWCLGGSLLGAALDSPASGALLGAMVSAIIFNGMYREEMEGRLAGSSIVLVMLGAALWGLSRWEWLGNQLPPSVVWNWAPAIVGALAGLLLLPYLSQHSRIALGALEFSKATPGERAAARFGAVLAALALVACFPWAARAASGLAHLSAGCGHFWMLRDPRAVAELTRAQRVNPWNATIYEERGECWQRMKRHDSAVADYTTLVDQFPMHVEYLLKRSRALQDAGQTARSLQDIQAALAAARQNSRVHARQADLLDHLKLYEPAIEAFNRALALDAGNSHALHGKADSLRMLGRNDEALSAYGAALKADPKSPAGHAGLGWVYLSQERIEDAVREFTLAVELSPRRNYAHAGLGWARLRRGDPRSALEDFRQALELDGSSGSAFEGRARCHFALENHEESLRDYSAAMQLDPVDPDLFAGRANVYRKLNQERLAQADQARAELLCQRQDSRKSQLAAAWESAAKSGSLGELERVLTAEQKK